MFFWLIMRAVPGQSLPPAETTQDALSRSTGAADAGGNPGTPSPAQKQVIPELNGILGERLPVQLGLTAGGYYDDNIYVQPSGRGRVSDFIWSLSPLIAWNSASETGATNSVQLIYAPTLIFYQDHSENDTVNEAADVVYGYEDDKVELTVSEAFAYYQENNADYDRLGNETSSITRLQFNYQLTGKTSLEVSARQMYTEDDPGFESIEWTLASYLNYAITPKTTLGLGGVLGAVDLEGPNQTYEQVNARIGYNPDAKLSFSATAGVEFRETQGASSADATPDFSLGAAYEPFDGTNLGLNGYRRYQYSQRFYGDDYLATGVSASIAQRFLRRFYFTVSGAFEDAQYRNNFSDTFANQSYDYFSVRPEVTFEPQGGFQLRVFYQYRDSLTSGPIAGFQDDQVGFTASFTY